MMKKLLFGAAGLLALSIGALGIGFVVILKTLPAPTLLENRVVAESTKIYDRTGGVLLYEIHGEERRTIIPLSEIPEAVIRATIAAEDADFYAHAAFDWKSVARALFINLSRGRIVQGGSTITQQLAKNAFLSSERTITRKIKELALAFQLEKRFTKDQILEAYLNQIPYGANTYGIEAASQIFFEKPARDLSLGEAALLASLPKAPTYYSPWGSNTKALYARREGILNAMRSAWDLPDEEIESALNKELRFGKPGQGIKAPHFVIWVQEYLGKKYGDDFVRTAGLRVVTTLDWDLQQIAEKAVSEGAARNEELYKGTNAALVAQDARTGQILALVGSRDYFDTERGGNFNVAAQGLRQPGSAIKPFVYAASFQKGYTPETIVFDVETEFDTTGNPAKSYKPGNYDERFRGPVTFREALAQSINVPSVKVLYLAGLDDALEVAKKLGLSTLTEKNRYGLSLVLGGGEVKLLDLVGAYSVFAQEGIKHRQSFISRVTSKNKVLEEYKDTAERVMDTGHARLINDILSDVSARKPLFANSLHLTTLPDREIALKTGTTNDYRDAWTVGYTPSLVVGVWAGNNNNSPMERKGGSILAAVPIWHAFASEALQKAPSEVFARPEKIYAEKGVLRGEYVIGYRADGIDLPQIHNLLFYLDRRSPRGDEPKNREGDPQFANWEKPVLAWVQKNMPNPESFNRPLPVNSLALEGTAVSLQNNVALAVVQPVSGEFIRDALRVSADVSSKEGIASFGVRLNGVPLDARMNVAAGSFRYENVFAPVNIELQNLLEVSLVGESGMKVKKEVIFFKQL